MISTREEEATNQSSEPALLPEDFHVLTIEETKKTPPLAPPVNLPKKSISLAQFTFLRREEEDREGRKSYHVVNVAKKNNENYYIKHNEAQSLMSELELVCWMWYKIAAPHLVPKKSYACYNEKFQFVAIASQEITGFESNHVRPLQDKDLIIDSVEHDFRYQRSRLLEILKNLSNCLHRPIYDETQYAFYSLWNCAKNACNAYLNYTPTALQVKWECDSFFLPEADLSRDKFFNLLKVLEARQEHIKKLASTDLYRMEEDLLKEAILHSKQLIALTLTDHVDIKKLERINRFAKINGYVLEKMQDAEKICMQVDGEMIESQVNDLKNYRRLKGVAEGTVLSYVNAEFDYHSKNGASNGQRIDFDMSEWEFLSQFKTCNFLDWLLNGISDNRIIDFFNPNKKSNENIFSFTERDIKNFPNLQDANFRYWPTKADLISKSGITITPIIFENFYTTANSETFKKLTIHPVFIFHKYKTFLKEILISDSMFRESAALCIRKDATIPQTNKNVLDEFVNYKLNRIQKLRTTLLNMPEFRDFLTENKGTVFQLIKEEFEEDILSYKKEMEEEGHDHYRHYINTINFTTMEKEFNRCLEMADSNTTSLGKSCFTQKP